MDGQERELNPLSLPSAFTTASFLPDRGGQALMKGEAQGNSGRPQLNTKRYKDEQLGGEYKTKQMLKHLESNPVLKKQPTCVFSRRNNGIQFQFL